MTDLSKRIRIEDPSFYLDDPYPVFARLRREDPMHYYAPLDTFVVTRYEDVRAISRDYHRFTTSDGVILNQLKYHEIGLKDEFYLENGEAIMYSEPPAHKELRRFLAPSFTPPSIRTMEPAMRSLTADLLDQIEPGEPFDIFARITAVLPVQAIALLMGLPTDDVEQIRYWSDLVMAGAAALEPGQLLEAARKLQTVHVYLDEHCERHRGAPGSAIIPTILREALRGEPVSPETVHTMLQDIMVAGHETTRDFLSGTVFAFAQHPEQFRRLREAPSSLSTTALEECLRWVTPVRGHARTVKVDTEHNGQPLRRGQHLWLVYMSANRDETVWADPDTFDIGRRPMPGHLTFGFGEHSCIGAAVARLEGRVFIEELAKRFSRIEIAGEPRTPPSVLHNSFESLPVVLFR